MFRFEHDDSAGTKLVMHTDAVEWLGDYDSVNSILGDFFMFLRGCGYALPPQDTLTGALFEVYEEWRMRDRKPVPTHLTGEELEDVESE